VKIENNFDGKVNKVNDILVSRKKDEGIHGIGLKSVEKTAEKYNGCFNHYMENDKFVAAICAGPTVLADLHITDGKQATCYPSCEEQMGNAIMHSDVPCIRDGKLITGASAGCAIPFALALIEALKGSDAAKAIEKQIVIR